MSVVNSTEIFEIPDVKINGNVQFSDDINSRIEKDSKVEITAIDSEMNSLDQHLSIAFKKLRERVIIYEYMCYKTSQHFSWWNRVFLYPSVILSSGLAFINSNVINSDINTYNTIKIVNVVSNGLLTLFIAIQNVQKSAEKADYFFNLKKKFSKLHNLLNNEIVGQISNLKFDQEALSEIKREYDNIDENIIYEFPKRIINDTKTKFKKFNLPTICNGIEIVEEEVEPRLFSLGSRKKKKRSYNIP
jgi:hypothetical protein